MKEVEDPQDKNFALPSMFHSYRLTQKVLENDEAKSEKTSLHNYMKNQRSLDEEDQKENKSVCLVKNFSYLFIIIEVKLLRR